MPRKRRNPLPASQDVLDSGPTLSTLDDPEKEAAMEEKADKRGRGRPRKITPAQEAKLYEVDQDAPLVRVAPSSAETQITPGAVGTAQAEVNSTATVERPPVFGWLMRQR